MCSITSPLLFRRFDATENIAAANARSAPLRAMGSLGKNTDKRLPDLGRHIFPAVRFRRPFDFDCLAHPNCYECDEAFIYDLSQIYERTGLVTETKHGHVVPRCEQPAPKHDVAPQAKTRSSFMASPHPTVALRTDDETIHLYARVEGDTRWFHLSVIVTTNKEGALQLRRFLLVPMESEHRLPPGAKC